MEQEKLINALNGGDTSAFQQLFDELYPRVYSFIDRIILDREEAQDIAANVFIKVWHKRADFKTLGKLRAFVFVTARNECYDSLKDKKTLIRRQKDFLYLCTDSEDGVANMEKSIKLPTFAEQERAQIQSDVYEYLLREVDQLPYQCRKVFQMSYLDGMKNTEIANTLGINEKTVRNQKVLAIKILRAAARSQYFLIVICQLLLFNNMLCRDNPGFQRFIFNTFINNASYIRIDY